MRLVRASLVSLLLLCLLTGAVNAQSCPPLQGVQATLEGAQFSCRTSTGGTYTAAEYGGGTSTHQWVYGTSGTGPWTPIPGATGTTYRLTGSDFPSTGLWWLAVTATPECGSPMTGGAQSVTIYDTLPAPDMFGNDQICAGATSAIAQSAAQWDSYSWSITHGTFIPGSNGCGDDPTKRCVSFRPDGTGEVHLSLTVTAGSCSSSALRAVPLVENPPPDLWVSSPVCSGGQGSAVSSQYPAGVRTWSVTNAHIDSDWGDHIIFTADGNGPVDVTLTFTDSNGCSSSNTGRANLAGTKPVITLGSPACSTNGTASANGGWDSYDWSITNGTITYGQGTANISFSGSGGGPMVLTVTGHANFGTMGCATASDPVTVPTVPTPTITLGSADICPYGTDTATAPEGYANYWWSLSNGYITAGDGTNSIRFSRSGFLNEPITVTLYVSDANGCSAPQATATVPIRTIPPPTITLDTADICPYGTDTATVPAQYANYWWSLSNGYIISGDGTNSIRFARGGGYPGGPQNEPISITLYVQDADGCPAPQATVTVPTRTIEAPVITLGTPDICPYGTNTATVPAQYANYWWSLNNGYIMSGDGTNSIRFARGGYPGGPQNEPITITLYVQDANGCPAPQATVTVPTRTIEAPVITLATPDICKYGTNTATVPAQYANYWWSLNNGYIMSGDGTNSITFSPGGYMPGGNYDPITITIYVQDANGCPAPQSTVTVPIRSIPAPTITLATPDVCLHGSDTASVPAQYANYWWSITGGFITGDSNSNSITFAPDPMGAGPITLSLYVQDANGCPAPQATVTVPIRTISPPQITVDTPEVCPLGSDSAMVPALYANYWWSITNGNLTGGQNTNSITFTPLNDTDPVTLSVSVQDANGCPVNSAPVTIPIRTLAPPPITLGAEALCPGSIGTASVPASYASYTWSVTNGTILGSDNLNAISFRSDGSANSVVVHVSAQEDSSSCPAQNSVTVPIRTLAPPVIALGTGSCPTTASVTNASDYMQFQWSADNAEISSSTFESSVTFHARQNGHVTLTVVVHDGNGCEATSSVGYDVTGLPDINMSLPGVPYCYGSAATASVPDGGPGVTYQWSLNSGRFLGSSTSSTVTFIPEADTLALTVTATNAQGCSASGTSYILVNRPPVGDFNSVPASVCANGTAIISTYANGVSYDWQVIDGEIVSGAGTSAITFRAHNAATVTVRLTKTGQYGCGATYERIIPVTSVDAAINPSGPTTFCTGGSVTLTASSGASYLWSTGATTQAITVSGGGSYSVTVTNANGCSATSAPTVVTVNANPTASITASGPTTFCAGGNVTLTASSAASYFWSTGETTQSVVASSSGNYSVTVTNGSGCSTTSAATVVTVNANPTASITAGGPTTFCAGGNVTLTASSAASYLWSTGETTQSIVASSSGNYSVTVTNGSGCSTTSAAIAVTVNPLPAATITASGPTTFCTGGNVTLTASTGASYLWSTGATTASIVASTAGNYSVTVTTAAGCSNTSQPLAVTVNALPDATITAPSSVCASTYGDNARVTSVFGGSYAWTITGGTITSGAGTYQIAFKPSGSDPVTLGVTVTNSNGCAASSTSVVDVHSVPKPTITPSGAASFCDSGVLSAPAGYTAYSWKRDGGQISGASAQTFVATQSGTYSVIVFDATNCWVESDPVSITVSTTPVASISAQNNVCAGTTYGAVSAGSAASYTWSVANGTLVDGQGTQVIHYTSGASGNVTLTLTVANAQGCSDTQSINIPIATVQATITPSGSLTICPAGSVTLTASAGASYIWSNNTYARSITVTQAGTYSVRVFDAAGCSAQSQSVTVSVASPSATITPSGPTTFCAGSNVTLSAPDGYSYTWSTGATTQAITVNQSNSYSVTVLDANGCTASSSATVTVNPLPTATVSGTSAICAGGSATITAALTGTAPWTVTWSDNVTQTINSGTSASRSVSPSATMVYTVTSITDANCTGTASGLATVTVNPLPTATVSGGGAICAGGSATITAALTGNGPFTVIWSDNVTQTINSGTSASRSVSPSATTTYTVTSLTDANCTGTSSGSATVTVRPLPTATVSGTSAICAGNSATITAALTGTAPFTVTWSDNVTQTINSGTSASRSVSPSATTTYTVTSLTDANCTGSSNGSATVTVNPLPTAVVSGTSAICAGGSATITAALTGTAPWTVIWSDNVTQTINSGTTASRTVNPSATTTYTVTSLTDANCTGTSSGSATVTVRPLPTATVSGTSAICAGGSATITAALTGSAPWTVIWSDNVTQTINSGTTASRSVNPSASTTYTVTSLTDANCTGTASGLATVTVNPLPTAVVSGTSAICAGGSATITAALTGSAPFTVTWSDNVTQTINSGTTASRSVSPSATTTFTVTSFNDANCSGTSSGSATVTVRPLPTATVSGTSAICPGASATITATLTGTAPWTVIWSDNVTQTINSGTTASRSVNPSATTTYTVTSLTDANCTGSSSGSATVTMNPQPTAVVSGTSAICPGSSTTITAALTGSAPWTVIWSDNVTQTINSGTSASRSVSPSTATTYTVTSLTDANCTGTSSGSAAITVKSLPTAAVSGGGTICPGGSATITATLTGTAPFTVIWSDNVTQTINSGTTASRTVSPAATTTYTVTSVTDAASCPRAGTGSATVTRNAAASITTQPSNVTTTRNTNITLSVVAAGTAPISYQWFNGNGTAISGATSSSYTTSFTKRGTNTFYVEVWNACNTTHVRSNTVTVTVN